MLLRVFDTFDADGDGFLSKDEIYAMKEASGRRSFGAEHPHASDPSSLLHSLFVDHANLSTMLMDCGVAGRVWSEAEHEFFCKTHGTRNPLGFRPPACDSLDTCAVAQDTTRQWYAARQEQSDQGAYCQACAADRCAGAWGVQGVPCSGLSEMFGEDPKELKQDFDALGLQ